jgi:ketosteroid isomerase-like protein
MTTIHPRAGLRLAAAVLLASMLAGCGGGGSGAAASATASTSPASTASVAQDTEAVRAVEDQWLKAITGGDRRTVDSILAPAYKHITSDGQLFDRSQEMAATTALPVTFNASDVLIDVVGDTAVIHGVNTIMHEGNVVGRERFTDVFIKQDGKWLAVAAHETKF